MVLHAATLLAILSCFWRDGVGILRESFQPSRARFLDRPGGRTMLLFLFLGTLPAAVAGMLAEGLVATSFGIPTSFR